MRTGRGCGEDSEKRAGKRKDKINQEGKKIIKTKGQGHEGRKA
jgi:hypothetical protein